MKHRFPDWFWLTGIAAALRFVNLGLENVWYDEAFTVWLAKLPLDRMIKAVQGDVHPPLWYLIEWLNIRAIGSSEIALRLPSAVLGVMAVLLLWQIALALNFERRTAFIAGLLVAVLPGPIYYSQEGRMYALLTCFVLWAALSAMKDRWWQFSAACIGTFYTQNLGAFYLAAIGIAVLIARFTAWRTLIRPALAGGVAGAAWVVWLPSLAAQASAMNKGFWLQPLTAGGLLFPLASMTLGWRIPEQLQMHVYGAAMALSVVGLINSRKWIFTRNGLIVLAVVLGAPALAALASTVWRSVYLPRAMLPSAVALMLVWAFPLMHLSRGNRNAARMVALPALVVALVSYYIPQPYSAREQISEWPAAIRAAWQPGDIVYHVSVYSVLLYGYYAPDLPWAVYPTNSQLEQSLSLDTRAAMGFPAHTMQLEQVKARRAFVVINVTPYINNDQLAEIDRIKAKYSYQRIKFKHYENLDAVQEIIVVEL